MDISNLKHYIRVYDHNLDAALCQKMIASFHGLEKLQRRNGRGIRKGLEGSSWTELNVSKLSDAAFLDLFRQTIYAALARYNRDVGLTIALPNSTQFSEIIMKRYRPDADERF